MTELEWRACTENRLLLFSIQDKGSERQRCLLGCACCRLVWHLLPHRCHRLVEAVEQYVDKKTTAKALASLFKDYRSLVVPSSEPGGYQAAEAVHKLGWD